jgi:hypothetical protein
VSGLRSAAVSAWRFVVGDDWRIALVVVLALAFTAVLADTSLAAWWVMPVAVVGVLAFSLRRPAQRR